METESDYPKGYRWPASKLTGSDMQKLCEVRAKTGKSITMLVREAVTVLHDQFTAAPDQSQLSTQSTPEPSDDYRAPARESA